MGSDSENEDVEFEGQSSDVEEEEEVDIDEDLADAVEAATSEASDLDHVCLMTSASVSTC
jgi:hypothetical protein